LIVFWLTPPSPTALYPLSLHDALPICAGPRDRRTRGGASRGGAPGGATRSAQGHADLAEPWVRRGALGPRRRRRSGRLIQGERSEDARALRTPAAERDVNVGPDQRDRGAIVEEVDGERRRFGEAALEPLAIA